MEKSAKVLVALAYFLTLTLVDIVVVEGYYRPAGAWNTIWVWHTIFDIFAFVMPCLIALRFRTRLPLLVPVLCAFGVEDTAFYWLQLRWPTTYTGVFILWLWAPPIQLVLPINLIGIALAYAIVTVS